MSHVLAKEGLMHHVDALYQAGYYLINDLQDTVRQTPPRMAVGRDEIAGHILSPTSDEGKAARRVPIRCRRYRKRRLVEIIKENQLEYNHFIKKKILKLMRILGVSSSSEVSD